MQNDKELRRLERGLCCDQGMLGYSWRPVGFPRPPHLPIDDKGRRRLSHLMSELSFVE